MLQKARVSVSEWLAKFRGASFAGRVTLLVGALIVFCLLCALAGLLR